MFGLTKHNLTEALRTLALLAPEGVRQKQPGPGQHRAQERLQAKLKANKAIPSGDRMTRQRIRATERAAVKKARVSDAERGRRLMKAARA